MKETQIQIMVRELRNKNITRYAIAKFCGVVWRTVVLWEEGIILSPRDSNLQKLKQLHKEIIFK